jgi:hypothetical protein
MKKVEFPTFLNEQPTIIFGRTGREIMIIICGIAGAYSVWSAASVLFADTGWQIGCVVVAICVFLLSLIVALVTVGSKRLEEWFFIWLFYAFMPKIFLYKTPEYFILTPRAEKKEEKEKKKGNKKEMYKIDDDDDIPDDFDED